MSFSLETHIPAAASSVEVTLPVIDWSLFTVDGDSPNETRLIRKTTGKSYPNTVTFQSRSRQDVYNNTNLQSSSLKSGIRSGTKAFGKNTEVWSKLNSADSSYEVLLPIQFECDCVAPDDPIVTPTAVLEHCDRGYAMFRQQLEELLLGGNNPKSND
jgi:hypothetical protein